MRMDNGGKKGTSILYILYLRLPEVTQLEASLGISHGWGSQY